MSSREWIRRDWKDKRAPGSGVAYSHINASTMVSDETHEVLKTIVESEGIRVHIARNAAKRCIEIAAVLTPDPYHVTFELSDLDIEAADTQSMVALVNERVRDMAHVLRLAAWDDLCGRMRLNTKEGRAAFIGILDDGTLTSEDFENLAIELMERVEVVPR